MTYKNLEVVAITQDIPEYGLKDGDTGTIVDVYEDGESYEVEFINRNGRTRALLTLTSDELRSVEDSPVHKWIEPVWGGALQSYTNSVNNSYGAGTETFCPQL